MRVDILRRDTDAGVVVFSVGVTYAAAKTHFSPVFCPPPPGRWNPDWRGGPQNNNTGPVGSGEELQK